MGLPTWSSACGIYPRRLSSTIAKYCIHTHTHTAPRCRHEQEGDARNRWALGIGSRQTSSAKMQTSRKNPGGGLRPNSRRLRPLLWPSRPNLKADPRRLEAVPSHLWNGLGPMWGLGNLRHGLIPNILTTSIMWRADSAQIWRARPNVCRVRTILGAGSAPPGWVDQSWGGFDHTEGDFDDCWGGFGQLRGGRGSSCACEGLRGKGNILARKCPGGTRFRPQTLCKHIAARLSARPSLRNLGRNLEDPQSHV